MNSLGCLPNLSVSSQELEKKSIFNKCFLFKKIEILHYGITGSVKVYRGFEKGWSYKPLRFLLPYQWHASIISFFVEYSNFFHGVNTLSSLGILVDIRNIIKHVKHLATTTQLLQFEEAMHVMRAVGSFFDNMAGTLFGLEGLNVAAKLSESHFLFLSSLVKTMTSAATSFMALGTLFSISSIVIHARKWSKVDEYYKDFIDNSGYRKDGDYKSDSYAVFLKYLNSREPKELKSYFLVNGNLLKAQLLHLCTDTENRGHSFAKLNSVLAKLEIRLKATKTSNKVTLISDASNLIGKALIISGLFHPAGYFLLGIFTLGRLTVFIQKKISAYRFESELGLILRDDKQEVSRYMTMRDKIKDFAIWFFGFHKYIPIPKLPRIRFNRPDFTLPLYLNKTRPNT